MSTATASRALSNPDLVAEDTRKAVHEAAASVGYKINLVARSLRTQRSNTLLVLFPGEDGQFTPDIIKGIESRAHDYGYSIIVGFTSAAGERTSAYFDLLTAKRADGLIVADDSHREVLDGPFSIAVPNVHLIETHRDTADGGVIIDDAAAAHLATRHLINLGHRRIAHISGLALSGVAARRIDGYRRALADGGVEFCPDYIIDGHFRFESGSQAVDRLLDLAKPPTAIFCANDSSALGALWQLRRRGVELPHAMSVVGFDDIPSAAVSDPPLTTIRQPRFDLGARASELLIELIEGRTHRGQTVTLPHALVVRESTAPPLYS